MSSPYQPEPGCTARQRQLEQQVHDLRQQLRAAEKELGERREQADQHRTVMARVTTELAALHEGEEPYEDERLVPTPAQWLWIWNRESTANRLSMAAHGLEMADRARQCVAGMHEPRIAQYDADRQAARVRAEAAEGRAGRYRLAWQSARRRAAAAEARVAELEPDGGGDWLTNVLYARKMSVIWGEPLVSPAFTGDKPQPAPAPEPVTVTARHLSYQRPACPGCEWAAHAPLTCDEVTAFRDRFDGLLTEQLGKIRVPDADDRKVIADTGLPPDEVHMRPHPHTTEVHESYVWEDEGEWKVSCDDCSAYVDNIGNEDDAKRWAAEHRGGERQL